MISSQIFGLHIMDINVVTLNVWGLPFGFASDKSKRIEAITKALASSKYDIICLQELWQKEDYNTLKQGLINTHPFHHFFYSGVIGSGLCIFSRWLIVETFFYQFPMNGIFHMIHHGDWLGGKGVGLACININGFMINVYNTHLHADYSDSCKKDHYYVHRLIQSFDAALFIRHTGSSADMCVLGGDLNSNPDDLCFKLLCGLSELKDSWAEANHKEKIPATNECLRNSYRPRSHELYFPGHRIDYVLFKTRIPHQVDVIESVFPLEARIPHTNISFSDHEAVLAKLRVHRVDSKEIQSSNAKTFFNEDRDSLLKYLKGCLETCRSEECSLRKDIRAYILCIFLILVISLTVPFILGDIFMLIIFLLFSIAFLCFQIVLITTRWLDLAWLTNAKKRLKVYVKNMKEGHF